MLRALALALLTLAATLLPGTAAAQTSETAGSLVLRLAPWLANEIATRWYVLAIAGAAGALSVALAAIGGVFPGIQGAAQIKKDEAELDAYRLLYRARQEDGVASDPDGADLHARITELERRIDRARWRQYFIAAPVYVAIGAAVAAFFAQDVVQAIVYGVIGPGVVAQVVAQRQQAKTVGEKDVTLEDAEKSIESLVKAVLAQSSRVKNAPADTKAVLGLEAVACAEEDATTAQKAKATLRRIQTAKRL